MFEIISEMNQMTTDLLILLGLTVSKKWYWLKVSIEKGYWKEEKTLQHDMKKFMWNSGKNSFKVSKLTKIA